MVIEKVQGLLIFFRDDKEITIPIDRDGFLLGRADSADVPFSDDQRMSRKHCRIYQKGDAFFIEDLGSRNGTFVNEERISKKLALESHDMIRIGHRKIIFVKDRRIEAPAAEQTIQLRYCGSCGGVIPSMEIEQGLAQKKGGGFLCADCSKSDARVNKVFGNYTILEKIAQGGMGMVYKARHRVMENTVALKMIREMDNTSEQEAVKRFMREVKLGARVNHPNIIRFLDAGKEEGVHYMVMEYVDGIPLSDKLLDGKPQLKTAAQITPQLLGAVEAIHDAEIVHRDIKPSNILLCRGSEIKLIDFGLVKNLGDKSASFLTGTDIGLGTIWYGSPEQFMAPDKVDYRADIYGIGATVFHLVCGEPPIKGLDSRSFYRNLMNFNLKDPCDLNPRIPRKFSDWLMKTLQKEPEDRFRNIKECRTAFEKVRD